MPGHYDHPNTTCTVCQRACPERVCCDASCTAERDPSGVLVVRHVAAVCVECCTCRPVAPVEPPQPSS